MRAAIVESLRVLVTVAVVLASFTTGLQAPRPDGARLWRRPSMLARALLAVLVLVPLWGLLLARTVPLPGATKDGLLLALLAVGIGPFAGMQRMKGTQPSARDALELNITVLVLSIFFVPAAIELLGVLFRRDVHLGVGQVAGVVLGRALVPLAIGLAAARLFPRFAAAAGPRLAKIATLTLLVVLVLAVGANWRELAAVGAAGWLTCLAAALGAVAIGHALGGPDPGTRGVVAAASAMRFPALGLMLASASAQPKRLVPVVLVYILTATLSVALYGAMMTRRARRTLPAAAAPQPT